MEKTIYIKSLQAKLVLEREFGLEAYQAIRNEISKYNEVKVNSSFDHDLLTIDRVTYGKIRVSRKNVVLYLALNPNRISKRYNVIDASEVTAYSKCPTKMIVNNQKRLKQALELLERTFKKYVTLKEPEIVDYSKVFYERTFTQLYKEGLIKKYVRKYADVDVSKIETKTDVENPVIDEDEEDEVEMHKVTFTAKLLYCATNQASDLYILTNVTDWDFAKAIKMDKVDDNTFTAIEFFEKGTKLEFKICRAQDWENVEKGIWKEEIVNHHYIIVNDDLEVEDLIHNFRIN